MFNTKTHYEWQFSIFNSYVKLPEGRLCARLIQILHRRTVATEDPPKVDGSMQKHDQEICGVTGILMWNHPHLKTTIFWCPSNYAPKSPGMIFVMSQYDNIIHYIHMTSYDYNIWLNQNNSLPWINDILGMMSLNLTMIPGFGRDLRVVIV